MTKKRVGGLRLRFTKDATKVLNWRIQHLAECVELSGKNIHLKRHYEARIEECRYLLGYVDDTDD